MQKHTSFCVTSELKELMDFLTDKEEIPNVIFLRKALRMFIEGEHIVDPRVLITQKTDPRYIKRDIRIPAYIAEEQYEALERIAEEKKCKVAQLIFQALVDYCALLASDLDEIVIERK